MRVFAGSGGTRPTATSRAVHLKPPLRSRIGGAGGGACDTDRSDRAFGKPCDGYRPWKLRRIEEETGGAPRDGELRHAGPEDEGAARRPGVEPRPKPKRSLDKSSAEGRDSNSGGRKSVPKKRDKFPYLSNLLQLPPQRPNF